MQNLKIYRKALIVVDMVNGFATEGGSLYDEEIRKIIPGQVKLIKECINSSSLIIFVKDTHTIESVEHDRFGGIKHCIKGSKEEELVDELKVFENRNDTISIEKNSTSFMETDEFRKVIDEATGLEKIEVCGCCTDICISNGVIPMMNYFDQHNRRVEVKVYEDLTETFNSELHNREEYSKAAYLLMAQQGAKILKKY